MPSLNSIYSKIQVVLDVADSASARSISELEQAIRGQRLPNFLARRYDPEIDAFVTDVSPRSIRRSLNLCLELELIGPDGDLTLLGRRAKRRDDFDRVVEAQVRRLLETHGVSFSGLNSIIRAELQRDEVALPTARRIWEAAGYDVDYELFARMIGLLAQCGAAVSSQKKIYLEFALSE